MAKWNVVSWNVTGVKLSYNDKAMSLDMNFLDYGISVVIILQAGALRFQMAIPNEYQGK